VSHALSIPAARVTERGAGYAWLLRELMSFHAMVQAARAEVEAEARQPIPEGTVSDGGAEAVGARLEEALRRQWEHARKVLSDRELASLRDVQYMMCALADDLFLHEVEWRGRPAWSANVLEQRIFGTRVAGERVFSRAAEIVARRDHAEGDTAVVTIATIGLGFMGRYRGAAGAEQLQALVRSLFELVAGRTADPVLGTASLVPGAIANVVSADRRLHYWRFATGTRVLLAVLAGFLLASTVLWFAMTNDLVAAANAVLRATE
jgi:type VI secretion system protein ImpK